VVGLDAGSDGVGAVQPFTKGLALPRQVVVEHRVAQLGPARFGQVEALGPPVDGDSQVLAGKMRRRYGGAPPEVA
jgi:hypothetical protein